MAGRSGFRFLRFAVGVVGGATCGTIVYEANKRGWFTSAFAASPLIEKHRNDFHLVNFNAIPTTKWDSNWDRREPDRLSQPKEKGILYSKEEREEFFDKLKPTATRHLILIRHGNYVTSGAVDEERILTKLGQEQADLTGQRLEALKYPYTEMINSTMARAKETADIIAKHLPDVPRLECSMLREGAPFPPEPPAAHWKPDVKFFEDGARIEAAFRKYFHRADPEQKEDSYEIFVCHANVIRYFVCRALQFPPEAWLRISLNHGSISVISIRPSGRITLKALGDTGHMPLEKISSR